MVADNLKKLNIADLLLLCATLLVGGFNEWVSCLVSAVALISLLVKIKQNDGLNVKLSLTGLSVLIICLSYGLSCFWAVDFGMAIIGFFKYLPLALFLLCLWQSENNAKALLPPLGAVLTLFSIVAMNINGLSSLFSVAGRLAGNFQYPNTFSLFLLVCELLILRKSKWQLLDLLSLPVLIVGILYTGSRTVFVLFIISNLAMLLTKLKKETLKMAAIIFGVLLAALIVLFFVGGDLFDRYLSISLSQSTFVGRILYFVDALPLLLKHPFGMGYMGYNYCQHEIQTGLYTVKFVHNSFLQLALDSGIIAAVIFIAAVLFSIFKKGVPTYKRIIIATIALHSFFDFNLQFISVFFILLIFMDDDKSKQVFLSNKPLNVLSCITLLILNLYMLIVLCFSHFGLASLSNTLYPFNTENKIAMLEKETDLKSANILADEILKQNDKSYVPYVMKAKYAYSTGDFNSVIKYNRTLLTKKPFSYEEYVDYCKMLLNGIAIYTKMGDTESIKVCQNELKWVSSKLKALPNNLSNLGRMISDQPETELPKEISDYVNRLE